MNCLECEARLQDQLDGLDLPDVEDTAVCAHLRTCTACRERHAAAQRLLKGLSLLAAPRPGAGLTDRILAAVLQDQRKRRLLRRPVLIGLALAASLAAVALVGYFWPRTQPPTAPTPGPVEVTEIPSLRATVAEAGSVLSAFTARTADETVAQTQMLLPPVPNPMMPEVHLGQTLDEPMRSLAETGQGVSTGLEPVTNSVKRAFGLFLRDLPALDPAPKSGL
jgi:anti-sigma factor RsiW